MESNPVFTGTNKLISPGCFPQLWAPYLQVIANVRALVCLNIEQNGKTQLNTINQAGSSP